MPPFMTFYTKKKIKAETAISKSKNKSKSKSKSISFSPTTKKNIASFSKKRKNKISQRVFRRIKNEQAENTCSICLESMLNNGPIIKTSCKHKFHSECLNTWLNTKTTCPICRRQIQAPIIVPQINPQLAQQIADAHDDTHELAILQMVENYWTERGMLPVQVELLKLCKLVALKLSRLVRSHSVVNNNAFTRAQTNAEDYARVHRLDLDYYYRLEDTVHRLDLDYYYRLEDTYHPRFPLEAVAPPPLGLLPRLSPLRTTYTI